MNCITKKTIVLFTVLGIMLTSTLAQAATVNVPATATVTAATLSLTQVTDISFGTIISTAQQSTVTLDATAGAATPAVTAGTATVSGGTSGLVTVGTNIDANVTISFTIKGLVDGTGADNILATVGSAQTMAITAASMDANSTPTNLAITVAGPNNIHVGGVLTVGASQVAGTYLGRAICTVIY